MGKTNFSFRTRLILAFTCMIILCTATFYKLVTFFAEQSLEHQLYTTRENLSRALQKEIQNRETILKQYVSGLQENIRFKAALEELNIGGDEEFLRQIFISNYRPSDFAYPPTLLSIADSEGNPRVRFLAPSGRSSSSLRTTAGSDLNALLEANSTVVSSPKSPESPLLQLVINQAATSARKGYLDPGNSVVHLSVGQKLVFSENNPVGAVLLGTPLDLEFLESLTRFQEVQSQVGLALNGTVVLHTHEHFTALFQLWKQGSRSHQKTLRRIQFKQKTFGLLSFPLAPFFGSGQADIASDSLELVLALDFSDEINRQNELLGHIFLVGLAAALASALLSLLIARTIARPIRDLVIGTEKLAEGDYPVAVDIQTHDEFGVLARSFNEMSKGLELRDRYRSLMDLVVSPAIAEQIRLQEEKGALNLGGDRQPVTILFADVRGFTQMSERLEPEMILEMLNEYFEIASHIIERHQGVVDKYIGDEIMALFGAPIAKPGDSERALLAALEIREALQKLNRSRVVAGKHGLEVGIGVASGEVVAGLMGSKNRLNYSVIGPTVNLAARLCGAATSFQVLVPDMLAGADPTYTYEPVEKLHLKGIQRDIQVYSVSRLVVS